jgi:hypothetical protein
MSCKQNELSFYMQKDGGGAKEKRKRGRDYLTWGAVGGLSDV